MADEGHLSRPPGSGNIAERLARIWAKVETLPHDGRVEGGGSSRSYTYTKVDARKRYFRKMLAEEGLVVIPQSSWAKNTHIELKTRNGSRSAHESHVHATWLLMASGTDEVRELSAEGYSQDSSDKAVNQASTFCVGNLISWVLMLDTGEDPERGVDHDAEVERVEPKRAERKQTGPADTQEPKRRSSAGGQRKISAAQLKRLHTVASNNGWPDSGKQWVYAQCSVPPDENGELSSTAITSAHYDDVVLALEEPFPPFEYVKDQLEAICRTAGMSVPEANEALRAAGFNSITDDIVGKGTEVFLRAHGAVLKAADAKAAA